MITHRYTSKEGALIGKSGVYQGSVIKLARYKSLIIGRDPKACDLVISSNCSKVSRVHCTISYDLANNVYTIKDESSNGTIISDCYGSTLLKGQTAQAHSKSLICIGNSQNSFELL